MISEDFVWLWVLLHSTGHSNVAGIPIKYGIQQHAWKGEISRWTRGNDTRNDALFSNGCKRSYLQDKQDDNMAMVQRRQTYDSVFPVFVVSVLFSTVAAERPHVISRSCAVRMPVWAEATTSRTSHVPGPINGEQLAASLQPEFAGVVTTVQRGALALPNSLSSQGIALWVAFVLWHDDVGWRGPPAPTALSENQGLLSIRSSCWLSCNLSAPRCSLLWHMTLAVYTSGQCLRLPQLLRQLRRSRQLKLAFMSAVSDMLKAGSTRHLYLASSPV